MKLFNSLFILYMPLYIYILTALYFILFIKYNFPQSTGFNFFNFHNANRSNFKLISFFVVLCTLLGTPPTIGFFGKVLVFSSIAKSGFYTCAAAAITLLLIVFYLQSLRSRSILKKKSNNFLEPNSTIGVYNMILVLFILSNFYIFVYMFFDIVVSWFF